MSNKYKGGVGLPFPGNSIAVIDPNDDTKVLIFDVSGATPGVPVVITLTQSFTPAAGTAAATDIPQTFTAGQRGEITVLVDAANIAIDLNASNNFVVTLGGNRTLANPSNVTPGQSGIIEVKQDATGTRTLAYGSEYIFAGGSEPVLTTTANAVDILGYYVNSASKIVITATLDVKQ